MHKNINIACGHLLVCEKEICELKIFFVRKWKIVVLCTRLWSLRWCFRWQIVPLIVARETWMVGIRSCKLFREKHLCTIEIWVSSNIDAASAFCFPYITSG